MNIKALRTLGCVAGLAVGTHLHGAVSITDLYSAGAPGNAAADLGGVFGYEIDVATAGFTAAGAGKLVMVFSGHDGNVAGIPRVANVTYDGAPLIEAVQLPDNLELATAGIFYLDNPGSDGILRIELAATSSATVHYGFGLYAVDGLKAGVQDTGSGRTATELTTTLPVTITTPEGFFVQEAVRNNQSFGDSVDDYTTLYNYSADSYRALSQYQVTSAAGDYVAPIGNTGENFRMVVAAGFEAVPEPSSALLVGLGGLVLLRRRC